ncbi:hypothetical protein F7C95_08820 [Opitutia bacterium ISCC 51]|nr:hypothetical protein F7C95_08820 [Opitutae bacterium ISCC 51]QXD30036.1 hypothetical protein GA003_08765 [Opitutae bacterium ISCC 52]
MTSTFEGYVEAHGKTVYEAVQGTFHKYTRRQGSPLWDGNFNIQSGEPPQPLSQGVLHPKNGKMGKISITDLFIGSNVVHFRGLGDIEGETN